MALTFQSLGLLLRCIEENVPILEELAQLRHKVNISCETPQKSSPVLSVQSISSNCSKVGQEKIEQSTPCRKSMAN